MVWSDAELTAVTGDQELIWRNLQGAAHSHDLLLGLRHVSHDCLVMLYNKAAGWKLGDIPNGVCDCQHVVSCFAYLFITGVRSPATGRQQSAPPNLICRVPYRDWPEWKGQKLDTHNRHLDGLREGWGEYQPTVGGAKLGLTGADPRCSLHSRNTHSPILSRRLRQPYYCRLLIFIYIILQMRLWCTVEAKKAFKLF